MKRYITCSWRTDIEEIEVTRETEKCYFVHNPHDRRHPEDRRLKGEHYHETWEAAHSYLLSKAARDMRIAQESAQKYADQLERIRLMRKPLSVAL